MHVAYRQLLPRRLRRWLRSLVVDCGLKQCRGFHLSHPALPRLPGIFLDQTWYCSPACLREALKMRVESQLSSAITDLRHPPRMPFRLILLAGGRVSEEQLAHARSVQAEGLGGEDIGEALVCLGYATEDEVAAARAAEVGCLYFAGAPQPVSPDYLIPPSLMRQHAAAAVHHSPVTGRVLVGFVYRINNPLLQAVEQVTGCRVEPCIITASSWRQLIAGLPAPAFAEVNKAAYSQSRMVSLIVEHAIDSHADKVRVGLSSNAIWARLSRGSRGVDLVIDLASDLGQGTEEPAVSGNAGAQSRFAGKPAQARESATIRASEIPIFERSIAKV